MANGGSKMQPVAQQVLAIQSAQLDFQLRADRLNAAMAQLVELLYAADKVGFPTGYDPITHALRVHVPWSSKFYRAWGLSGMDRIVLFRLTQEWRQLPLADQLLLERRKRWFLNLTYYPAIAQAQSWLLRERVDSRMVHSLQREGPVNLQAE